MSDEAQRAKITERVAKLLRQAEDVAGTPEEMAFQEKAMELLAKYGIDQAMVTAARRGIDAEPGAIEWICGIDGKYERMQVMVLCSIARALHCSAVYEHHMKIWYRVYIYGMPRHVERIQMLWEIMQPQMLRMAASVTGGRNTTSYRRAYIAGYASAISTRIREQEAKAVEGAGGGALVLYRSDGEKAQQAMREASPYVRSTKVAGFHSGGYAHGQRDGQNASMQREVR